VMNNSTNSKFVFKLQKIAIRIIMGAKNNDSCRGLLKLLKILNVIHPDVLMDTK
jgi:hypothetical protein